MWLKGEKCGCGMGDNGDRMRVWLEHFVPDIRLVSAFNSVSIGNLTGFRFSTDHLGYNGCIYTYMYDDHMMEGAHWCISNWNNDIINSTIGIIYYSGINMNEEKIFFKLMRMNWIQCFVLSSEIGIDRNWRNSCYC